MPVRCRTNGNFRFDSSPYRSNMSYLYFAPRDLQQALLKNLLDPYRHNHSLKELVRLVGGKLIKMVLSMSKMLAIFGKCVLAGACVALAGCTKILPNKMSSTSEDQTTNVYVATQDIPEGKRFTSDMLEARKVLKSKVPEHAVLNPIDVVGGKSARSWKKGAIVLNILENDGDDFPVKFANGRKAVLVLIDFNEANDKLIHPGDRVDIFRVPKGNPKKSLKVLSNAEVVNISRDNSHRQSGVIVLASPSEERDLTDSALANKFFLMKHNLKIRVPPM